MNTIYAILIQIAIHWIIIKENVEKNSLKRKNFLMTDY